MNLLFRQSAKLGNDVAFAHRLCVVDAFTLCHVCRNARRRDCRTASVRFVFDVRDHIIRVTDRAFDDFAGGDVDHAANRKMLGV